jgi:hypothetical protein
MSGIEIDGTGLAEGEGEGEALGDDVGGRVWVEVEVGS